MENFRKISCGSMEYLFCNILHTFLLLRTGDDYTSGCHADS